MKKNLFKVMFPLMVFLYAIHAKLMIFFAFDPESLGGISTQSKSGGGFTSVRFAPKSYLDVIPLPDADNPELTSNDFVFKTGKDWIPIFVDDYETDAPEAQGEGRYANSYISTCNFHVPGDNNNIRKAINEGVFNEEGYLLIDNCKDIDTTLFGKGKCCAGKFKISYETGKKSSEKKGWNFIYTVEQEGVNTKYKGVGAMNVEYTVAVDDATPDVSKGTATYILPENTEATAITALDNAVQGSLITLKWASTTNHSTIANGATFQLSAAFAPATGAILVLQATTTTTFAERYRKIPS